MELLCSAIEILASFTEGILILSTIITAAGPKYGKVKTYWLTFFCAVLTTGYLIVMNAWSGFSFITPIGGILFYIFCWKVALEGKACVANYFLRSSFLCGTNHRLYTHYRGSVAIWKPSKLLLPLPTAWLAKNRLFIS